MSQASTHFENSTLLPNNNQQNELSQEKAHVSHTHIAILGTGFAGLGMAIRLKQEGFEDFVVLEKATDVGGNWRDNTYPGCACNIPSNLYSFSFAPNPDWSHEYPQQPEIRAYLRSCAERFDILPHIRWNTELLEAAWNEEEKMWHIITSQGLFTSDIFMCGNGQLTDPLFPSIPGLKSFEGVLFHSADWKHDYDLAGKRVAVVGTGASSLQFIPQIQSKVGQLLIFQRTPSWIVPYLASPTTPEQRARYRKRPIMQRFVRAKVYVRNELTALKILQHPRVTALGIRMAQKFMDEQISDPALKEKLTPKGDIACGRFLRSDNYYAALAQPNVDVITTSIQEIRAHSIVTKDGQEHEVDAIICGTGFHVTDARFPQRLRGRDGQTLAEKMTSGFCAYMGTTVPGFPNLFWICGPGTSLPHNSMVCIVEAQATYVLDCLRLMKRRKVQSVEVRPEQQKTYNAEMLRRNQGSLEGACNPDSNNRDVVAWPGTTTEFFLRTRRFDAKHYTFQGKASAQQSELVSSHLPSLAEQRP